MLCFLAQPIFGQKPVVNAISKYDDGKTKTVDAILDYGDGKVYAFNGEQYSRYDKATSKVDAGYPKATAANWKGMPVSNITAAVYDESKPNWKKAYLFHDGIFWRFDKNTDKVDAGYPKRISIEWHGLPDKPLDAVISFQNNYMYFFYDNYCYLYDRNANNTVGKARLIADEFKGVPNNIDAAVYYKSNDKIYFFKGNEYYRVSKATKTVDAGYPKNIAEHWKGLEKLRPYSFVEVEPVQKPTNQIPQYIHVTLKTIKVEKAPPIIVKGRNGKKDDAATAVWKNKAVLACGDEIKFNKKTGVCINEDRFVKGIDYRIGDENKIDQTTSFSIPKNQKVTDENMTIKIWVRLSNLQEKGDNDFYDLTDFNNPTVVEIPYSSFPAIGSKTEKRIKVVSKKGDAVIYFTYEIERTLSRKD